MTNLAVDMGPDLWTVLGFFALTVLVAGAGSLVGYGLGVEHRDGGQDE